MATRSLAIAGSSMAAAEGSSSAMSSKRTTKTYTYKTDGSGNVSTEVHTHVDSSNDLSSSTIRRLEERIRIIQDDFESEQSLRKRIEREKQSLQMQIITLSERLTEAEGGAESQLDINRKREAEMAKLRKLLEDVHIESEQSIHILKTKHQEAMMELQEQIEMVSKSKEKVMREKTKMQSEIAELMALIEVLNKEKSSMKTVCEKLEIQINEYNVKMESMNKTVLDLSSQKTRLAQENQDSTRRLNDMRHAIESAGLDKNKVAGQMKDLQDNLDGLVRAKSQAESKVKALEQQLRTMSIELDEYREVRVSLEKQVGQYKDEAVDWKRKYENECRLHIEDVDTLKKKFTAEISHLQDAYDAAMSKLKQMEQQKNKLQQEVQIMVKEVERSQVTIKEVTSALHMTERKCDELAAKLKEMTNMYERADKENKMRAQELVRLANDMDRCKMENETLRRDKGKAEDEARALKGELDNLKQRLHAAEMENRKLAHDREELARAYKDADAGKMKAESFIKQLEDEIKKLKADAQHKISMMEGENITIKKKLTEEIERLTIRLQETESRLRNEVEKMKKKMSVTITGLEMSLDGANKANVQLQNSNKMQATKISELTQAYEVVQQKLVSITDQYNGAAQRLQHADNEVHVVKRELQQALNSQKISETKIVEITNRLTEITNINNSLSQVKVKLEKELAQVTAGYNDMGRELKLADDRANKAAHDAQHFEGLLREEQVKINKIDNAKRALESEVKSLTVRMEEIETTAVTTSKRTIQKMEVRIEELESMLQKEKAMHVETTTVLHKKDRSVKELLMQSEEDRKNILILQESLDRLNEKIKMYKRQLEEQEAISNSNIMRVKKFQRELEAAEGRAQEAESSLNSFRSQQRVYAAAASDSRRDVQDVESSVVIRKNIVNVSSSNVQESSLSSSSASNQITSSSARDYRGGSTYSRAGSMARASMARATSVGRASSMLRY